MLQKATIAYTITTGKVDQVIFLNSIYLSALILQIISINTPMEIIPPFHNEWLKLKNRFGKNYSIKSSLYLHF